MQFVDYKECDESERQKACWMKPTDKMRENFDQKYHRDSKGLFPLHIYTIGLNCTQIQFQIAISN